MKVDNNGINPLSTNKPDAMSGVDKNQRPMETPGGAEPVAKKDRAEFSDNARLLAKVRYAFDDTQAVRSERVDQLREQIKSNQYVVRHDEIANRLASRFKR